MLRTFLLINTILLFFYHAGVIFASMMQIANFRTKQEVIDNLYWIIPQYFLLASVPNLLMYVYFRYKGRKAKLNRNFWIAELFVVFLYSAIQFLIITL
jgi:hypothetical protein